jgi:hypothetical protein
VREHTTVASAAESGTRDEHLDGASAGISIACSEGCWRGEAQAQGRAVPAAELFLAILSGWSGDVLILGKGPIVLILRS